MKEILSKLIKEIVFIQSIVNEYWKKDTRYLEYNMRKYNVIDILNNDKLEKMIYDYRDFISVNNFLLTFCITKEIQYAKDNLEVNMRVKAYNSIQYKIENYIKNHNNGKESINKCLNDIFGVRIILDEEFSYDDIRNIADECNKKLKTNLECIDASKNNYNAIHIYFKIDNNSFKWELQIWNKKYKNSNLRSHSIYKQDYLRWEKEGDK